MAHLASFTRALNNGTGVLRRVGHSIIRQRERDLGFDLLAVRRDLLQLLVDLSLVVDLSASAANPHGNLVNVDRVFLVPERNTLHRLLHRAVAILAFRSLHSSSLSNANTVMMLRHHLSFL